LGPAVPPGADPEGDVLENGQVRKQKGILEDESDATPLSWYAHVSPHVLQNRFLQDDPAARQGKQSGQGSKQRGLTGAVRAKEHNHLPRLGVDARIEL
jgi:hypothetical protein